MKQLVIDLRSAFASLRAPAKPALAALALVAACDNPLGGKSLTGGESSGQGIGTPTAAPASDWSGKKLVPAEGNIDGIDFVIDVPEGLPRDAKNMADWNDRDPRNEHQPKVFTSTIEINRIQDLKDAKYNATLNAAAQTWVRQQARPDGWALTMVEDDQSRVEAVTYRTANDTMFIKCKAVQYTDGGALPSYKKTMAMLEKTCDSLKIKAK